MEVDCSPQDHHCQFLKVFSDFYETKTRKESRANEGRRYSIRKIHTSVSVIFIRTCLAKAMLWFIDLCQGWIANIYIVLSGLGLCDVLIDVLLLKHCSWCSLHKGLVAPQRQAVATNREKFKDQVQQKSACTSHVNLIVYSLGIEDNKARQWLDLGLTSDKKGNVSVE